MTPYFIALGAIAIGMWVTVLAFWRITSRDTGGEEKDGTLAYSASYKQQPTISFGTKLTLLIIVFMVSIGIAAPFVYEIAYVDGPGKPHEGVALLKKKNQALEARVKETSAELIKAENENGQLQIDLGKVKEERDRLQNKVKEYATLADKNKELHDRVELQEREINKQAGKIKKQIEQYEKADRELKDANAKLVAADKVINDLNKKLNMKEKPFIVRGLYKKDEQVEGGKGELVFLQVKFAKVVKDGFTLSLSPGKWRAYDVGRGEDGKHRLIYLGELQIPESQTSAALPTQAVQKHSVEQRAISIDINKILIPQASLTRGSRQNHE